MIAIEIITGREAASFGPRLADFLNGHPDAKILAILLKGLEGARGLMAVLSYDKKEAPKPKPIPEPKKPKVDPNIAEIQRLKDQLVELQALKELEKEAEAEVIVEVI